MACTTEQRPPEQGLKGLQKFKIIESYTTLCLKSVTKHMSHLLAVSLLSTLVSSEQTERVHERGGPQVEGVGQNLGGGP